MAYRQLKPYNQGQVQEHIRRGLGSVDISQPIHLVPASDLNIGGAVPIGNAPYLASEWDPSAYSVPVPLTFDNAPLSQYLMANAPAVAPAGLPSWVWLAGAALALLVFSGRQ